MVVKTVFAMMMIVNGSMDGFMMTNGLADCLKSKREAERNLAENRKNEYPTIEECVHAILDDTLDDLQAKRKAVKEKYPK